MAKNGFFFPKPDVDHINPHQSLFSLCHLLLMIRFVTIWLLTLAVFLQSLAPLLILVDFKIHQDFIAEVLCINRDRPELQCNGQCHLQDKLSEQQQKEQQLPKQVEEKIPVFFMERLPAFLLQHTPKHIITYLPYRPHLHDYLSADDFFHPPRLS